MIADRTFYMFRDLKKKKKTVKKTKKKKKKKIKKNQKKKKKNILTYVPNFFSMLHQWAISDSASPPPRRFQLYVYKKSGISLALLPIFPGNSDFFWKSV